MLMSPDDRFMGPVPSEIGVNVSPGGSVLRSERIRVDRDVPCSGSGSG